MIPAPNSGRSVLLACLARLGQYWPHVGPPSQPSRQHSGRRRFTQWALGLGVAQLLAASMPTPAASATSNSIPTLPGHAVTVGMEGQVEVLIPGAPLEAKAVDDKAPLLLRIAATRPHGTATHYDLRYIGLEPGTYDLRTLLVGTDGRTPTHVAPIEVRVSGLLPRDHDGLLEAADRGVMGRLGGYRVVMTAATVLWVTGLGVWFLRRRSRRPVAAPVVAAPEPTFADRLRPLVLEASRGQLPTEGQAHLERLLVAYWRDRLGLHGLEATAALQQLREHPEAGRTLRDLERWLHHPAGASPAEVESWLAPYRVGIADSAPTQRPLEPSAAPSSPRRESA